MSKRTDIEKIMIIGSGPIAIGQACEFDYSGTQACKVLREEGYYVILINSNPATIMTDFGTANRIYIEPITPKMVSEVIKKERPDAILPTLGGQTGLNTVLSLSEIGILEEFGIEIIGANLTSINKAESRDQFKKTMENIGLRVTKSKIAGTLNEAVDILDEIGFPLIVRASFTMGGLGSSVINDVDGLYESVFKALKVSPISQVILEESLIGWKEYELELMRDCQDNVVVVCSIENIDPVGVHTGDSMTVAPIQTLTDKEYQVMRDAAIGIMREIGVDTGGANVQFAVNPATGEMVVIEMNPRVSRSSALASKATGFPIAKIATKLAIGYTLDEIDNDITGKTMACFEPSMDYCVVKIPVWDTDKFHESEDILGTSMKSVGEAMAIGRTFKEAFQKAIRSLGIGIHGFSSDSLGVAISHEVPRTVQETIKCLGIASSKRLFHIYHAFYQGIDIMEVSQITGIDPWFIFQFHQIFEMERAFCRKFAGKNIFDIFTQQKLKDDYKVALVKVKSLGFSDIQIANLIGMQEEDVARCRQIMSLQPVYNSVDTCAGEFHANSPYYYSTYESECEVKSLKHKKKIIVLGSGPNRIGQGIEFDYCCVHASLALREEGVESIVINSNPGTVSTDYDISDKLYFEPLTYEDVMNVVYKEDPFGVIVQFGGQIPLNLSRSLEKAGVAILGTQPANIDRAEDRGLFKTMLGELGLDCPASVAVTSIEEAVGAAKLIGYPVMVRPSFVLGGKAINVAYDHDSLINFTNIAISVSRNSPVLIDDFLQNAVEVDVDVISDGYTSVICGIMEHVEEAGIHSGDSALVLPPRNIDSSMLDRITSVSKCMALELNIIGLMNVQYAIRDDRLYIIEVNPRASRTIPFVSKATGIPIALLATKIMLGKNLIQLGLTSEIVSEHVSVKESVFPFDRFTNSDILLGPSMKSTGEVMGIGSSFEMAYARAQLGAGQCIPLSGRVFVGCYENNVKVTIYLINRFKRLGFDILTDGLCDSVDFSTVKSTKKYRDCSPIIDAIETGQIQLLVTMDRVGVFNKFGCDIRRAALRAGVMNVTTVSAAVAVCDTVEFLLKRKEFKVKSLQEYHKKID